MTNEIKLQSSSESHNLGIEISLDRYCLSKTPPKYAVQLKGPWGSGKTWFALKLKERLESLGKKVLYASFFGAKSTKDITDQFFTQMHPIIGSEKARRLGSIARQIVKATIKIDLNGDSNEDGSLQLSIPEIEKWSASNGTILIFDDLERAGQPIDDCLGFINQFIEHDDYRAIIIANDDAPAIKALGFSSIREKVIGRVFEVQPNQLDAIETFLKEISDRSGHQLAVSNKNLFLSAFSRSNHKNLRLLRQSILDFADLWDDIKGSMPRINKTFVEHLINETAAISIEFRYGTWDENDILELETTNWMAYLDSDSTGSKTSSESNKATAARRHGFASGKVFAVPCIAYAKFFQTGTLVTDDAEHAIGLSPYFSEDGEAAWRKLWHLYSLDSGSFKKYYTETFESLSESNFGSTAEFIHIAALLLSLSSKKLITPTSNQILSLSENALKRAFRKDIFAPPSTHELKYLVRDGSAFGLGFANSSSAEYTKLLESTQRIVAIERKKWVKEHSESWMRKLVSDTSAWCRELEKDSEYIGDFVDDPVFSYINPREFIDSFLDLSPEEREMVLEALATRYQSINIFAGWIKEEIDFLRKAENRTQIRIQKLKRVGDTFSAFLLEKKLAPKFSSWIKSIESTNFQ